MEKVQGRILCKYVTVCVKKGKTYMSAFSFGLGGFFFPTPVQGKKKKTEKKERNFGKEDYLLFPENSTVSFLSLATYNNR